MLCLVLVEVNQYLIEEVSSRSVNASYINEFRTSNFVLITDVLDVDRFIKIVTNDG